MFIVAMTLAVLAAMGVYALQIASDEIKTAGFVRQQLQTQYLSEYGVSAIAQALSNNSQMYATIMSSQPDTGCYSLFQISTQSTANPQAQACHRAGSPELGGQVVPSGTSPATLLSAWTASGSDLTRGMIGIQSSPDFFVEVTDPNQRQPPPGYATNASAPVCFIQVTASAFGLTPMTQTSSATDTFLAGSTPGFLSEGLEMSRARVMFGPVRCTGTK
jgi:hypothetical protein